MSGGIGERLSDKACKAFVAQNPRGKKLADGGGLYLFITPSLPAGLLLLLKGDLLQKGNGGDRWI